MKIPLENPSGTNCDVPELWLQHNRELRNFIFKRVKDPDLTNDILQEVLLKVYNYCITKSGVRNIRSWLFQIAQNTITDHYRKNSRIRITDKVIPDEPGENENTAFQEALNYILPILEFLPQKYATPLKMADIVGMKQADIALKLGLSLPATKSRVQRGRELLMAEFITCCHLEKNVAGNLLSFSIKDSCTPLQNYKEKISR